jgi:hypothetical protein
MRLEYIEELGRFSLTVKRFLGLCLVIAAALFAMGFALEAIRVSRWGNSPTSEIVLCGVACGFLGWGIRLHRQGCNGKQHPVYALLRDRRQEIVWVTRVIAEGTGRDHVTFHLESGACGGNLLVPTSDALEIIAQLERDLPHATFGTSDQLAALYQRDPGQLRREASI